MKTNFYKYSLVATIFFTTNALATIAYVSPTGVGDGYSIENPSNIKDINKLLSDPDLDTIKLLAGTYLQDDALFINSGNHSIKVIGEDRVIFSGDYNYEPGGNAGLIIARSNITFKNLNFLNTRYCFRFKNNDVKNVSIDQITAHNTMSCVDFDSNITSDVSNISLNDIKSLGYHKSGIRINGETPKNISITNSVFDGLASSSDLERGCHITGISVSGSTKDVLIKNVSISNNIGGINNCGSYQQGDGIVINSNVSNVSIINTVVGNSKDADFDIKGVNTTLVGITSSSGKEARYNLKLWNNEYTCQNCYINVANVNAIQAIDAKVQFVNSTIKVKDNSNICDLRNYTTEPSSIKFLSSSYSYNGYLSYIPDNVENCQ